MDEKPTFTNLRKKKKKNDFTNQLYLSTLLFGGICELISCLHMYKLKFAYSTILFCKLCMPLKMNHLCMLRRHFSKF